MFDWKLSTLDDEEWGYCVIVGIMLWTSFMIVKWAAGGAVAIGPDVISLILTTYLFAVFVTVSKATETDDESTEQAFETASEE